MAKHFRTGRQSGSLRRIVVDISDRKEQELRVQYLIEHDNVTGLYNRNRLEELLTADKGRSGKRALVKINLSKIHLLTITYGYNYSTELTQKVAKALSSLCSEECMLFSTHSSRFLFYVEGLQRQAGFDEFMRSFSKP